MCERSGFWRWLAQVLAKDIRKVPRLIRGPGLEQVIGFLGTLGFLCYAIFSNPELPEITRIALSLPSIPSFIIFMHGRYREGHF